MSVWTADDYVSIIQNSIAWWSVPVNCNISQFFSSFSRLTPDQEEANATDVEDSQQTIVSGEKKNLQNSLIYFQHTSFWNNILTCADTSWTKGPSSYISSLKLKHVFI